MDCTCQAVPVSGLIYHSKSCAAYTGPTRKLGTETGIRSIQLNARDAGFEHETNDCAVKAVSAATGIPYRDAHAWCRVNFNRKDKQGALDWEARLLKFSNYKLLLYGFRVFRREPIIGQRLSINRVWGTTTRKPRYQTLADFVRTHRTGRYLIASNYHACAVIDGIVFDNGAAGPRTQITSIYELVESSKCEARGI